MLFDDAYENDDEALNYSQEETDAAAQQVDWAVMTAQHELEIWESPRPPMMVQTDWDCPPF